METSIFENVWSQFKQIDLKVIFTYILEVVGRGIETQLQVGEDSNYFI